MIKGRYVAQIEVDFQYTGKDGDYKMMHDRIQSEWLDNTIAELVSKVFVGGTSAITVTKQYGDVTETKEGEE
jgi:hypothetical protein